jgi:hypothetical protein
MVFTMFLAHSSCTAIVKCNYKIGLYTRADIEYPHYSGSFRRPEQLNKGMWKVEEVLKFLPHKDISGELMAVQLINNTKSEEYPARMIVIGYDEFGTNEFSIISQNSEIYTIQNTYIDLSEKNGVVVLTLEDEGGDGYYSTVWRFRYQDNCFRLIGYDNIYGDRAEYNPSVSTDSYNYLTNKHEEIREVSRKGKSTISKKKSIIKTKYIRCLENITHDFQAE